MSWPAWLGLVAAGVAAAPLYAQTVEVRARGADGGRPLVGALASLRDASDRPVARALTDERGRARLQARGPGRYTVRLDAIGYRGDTRSVVLARDSAITREFILEVSPLALDEIRVSSSRPVVCTLTEEQGTLLARLWDEARKALTATAVTRETRAPMLEVATYRIVADELGRLRDDDREVRLTRTFRPFSATDARDLQRRGWVQRRGSGGAWYHGPDAELLLSEAFLDDHCFSVRRPANDDSFIGLAFEPAPKRSKPDVAGVLWLDRVTAELRSIEFAYRNVDPPTLARDVRGRVSLAQLPDGAWYVGAWRIRGPTHALYPCTRPNGKEGVGDSTTGVWEAGGGARPATGPLDIRLAVLTGRVLDTVTRVPVKDAVVSMLAGRLADTTDAEGWFRLEARLSGVYLVSLRNPRLERRRRGYQGGPAVPIVHAIALSPGRADTVDFLALWRASPKLPACPDATDR